MKWTKFTLETTTDAVDLISDMLNDLGIEGIEIEDKIPISEEDKKRLFIDFLPDLGEDDGIAKVNFYVDPADNTETILENIRAGLKELAEFVIVGSCNITVSETEDTDWINNWKQFFKPFRIDDTIVIKPTWEQLTDFKDTDLIIEIDPGTSFGTGSHETTKLCIVSIKKYIKPEAVILDAGSGSGILSIIAKKLGAKEVLGIDIDPIATSSAIENAIVNKIPVKELVNISDLMNISDLKNQTSSSLSFMTGNIIEDDGVRHQIGKDKFDMVVANILADVIIPLSKVIGENLKQDGIFISSGIINTKENAVREALINNHFEIVEVNIMGDWVSFVARKS